MASVLGAELEVVQLSVEEPWVKVQACPEFPFQAHWAKAEPWRKKPAASKIKKLPRILKSKPGLEAVK
jgi:hypothetical protein